MPRSRPASSPLSFHKPTGQFYVTRGGRRVYLGANQDEAIKKYHRLALGLQAVERQASISGMAAKELANRFLDAQQANWRSPVETLRSYRHWLERFLADHPGLQAEAFTAEMFAAWKMSLRHRNYSAESINHFLCAVRAMYRFGDESGLIERVPRLRRVKNETCPRVGSKEKPLYAPKQLRSLLDGAESQMKVMLLLGLNCGFGPKDIQDLKWDDFEDDRVTLPRSKTGICQTFLLWPETQQALKELKQQRSELIERLALRNRIRTDAGLVFITRYWQPWSKDAVSHEFRKLCKDADIPCYGFYRLRHCASTAMSLVANPHVQRKFMRHSQLQQQVTYTHTPDAEVDAALTKARGKLLGVSTAGPESDPEQVGAA